MLHDPLPPVREALRAAGLETWQRLRDTGLAVPVSSREQQMDQARRRQVAARVDAAVRERVAADAALSAVLVHRRPWTRDKVAALLAACGVDVVAALEDGAEGLGAVVVEQPDLVLVEDALPSLGGLELVATIRQVAPVTRIGVQAADEGARDALLEAGAAAAWTRTATPQEIADGLRRLLTL